MESPLLYFLVGLLACFIGTIPFGPINLTVVKITVDYDRLRGSEVALAASLVEIFQALVAISFGALISAFLESNLAIKLIIAAAFVVLAAVVLLRRSDPTLDVSRDPAGSFFRRGLLIAALNPQALPYWIFALAAISQYVQFQYAGLYLVAFLAGVFAGKLAALHCFLLAAAYLKAHLRQSSVLVNRLLAAILLLIGLSQAWNALAGAAG